VFAKFIASVAALGLGFVCALPSPPVSAQERSYSQDAALDRDATFSTAEIDQILAPIALYPDDLLANVLMASTYPLEMVEAARWLEKSDNSDLKGDALTRALDDQDWDPSVKSLTAFPDVLDMMSENLDWTRKLGDAVLSDQARVMDRVQFLRDKADASGHLESNEYRKVSNRRVDDEDYYYIEPAEPDVVYVPVYEPTVVYGGWWYDDYPPYYWPLADDYYYDGYYWGIGVAIAPALWDWSRPRWHQHYIHINSKKYNRLRHRRHKKFRSDRWRHDRHHRRGVRYDRKRDDKRARDGRSDGGNKSFKLRNPDRRFGKAKSKRDGRPDGRKGFKRGGPGDRKNVKRFNGPKKADKRGPPKKQFAPVNKRKPDVRKGFNKKKVQKKNGVAKGKRNFKNKKKGIGKRKSGPKKAKSFNKKRKAVKRKAGKSKGVKRKAGKRKAGKRRVGKRPAGKRGGGKKKGGGKKGKKKN
jgi:Protein of unknown function (DUF3300)